MLWLAVGLIALFAVTAIVVVGRQSRRPKPPSTPHIIEGDFDALAHRMLTTSEPTGEVSRADGSTLVLTLQPPRRPTLWETSKQSIGGDALHNAVVSTPAALFAGGTMALSCQLDHSMLDALSQLSDQQVDGLYDFLQIQDLKAYQLDSIKLRGTIGEQVSADSFEAAGQDVSWPPGGATEFGASNNPGWDHTVDGQSVNVKVTQDAADAAREHFATYPDIPMVVNADAANIPPDAIYFNPADGFDPSLLLGDHVVVVDEALTLSGIESIQQAAEDLLDAGDALQGFGDAVPGLTLVTSAFFSSIREARLMAKGKTDASRAMKNVAIDTTARGGGAGSGAAIGIGIDLATGGMLFGLPTLIGTYLGAKGGGKVATHLRHGPLREAQRVLQTRLEELDAAAREQTSTAERDLKTAVLRELEATHTCAAQAHEAYAAELAALRRTFNGATTMRPATARALVAAQAEGLHRDLALYETAIDGPVTRWLLRSDRTAARSAVHEWERRAMVAAETVESEGVGPLFDAIMATPGGDDLARQFLQHTVNVRREVQERALAGDRQMVAVIGAARASAVEHLTQQRDALVEEAQTTLAAATVPVTSARDDVWRELEKAGLRD